MPLFPIGLPLGFSRHLFSLTKNSLTSSLCAQRSRTKIKDSRGKRARPQIPAPPSQFSSLSPPATCSGLEKKKSKG